MKMRRTKRGIERRKREKKKQDIYDNSEIIASTNTATAMAATSNKQ